MEGSNKYMWGVSILQQRIAEAVVGTSTVFGDIESEELTGFGK